MSRCNTKIHFLWFLETILSCSFHLPWFNNGFLVLDSWPFCLKIHNDLDLMSNSSGFRLRSVIPVTHFYFNKSRAFFLFFFFLNVQNACAVRNESVWPFFNLSIHMDIPLMYLGLYLNVSILTLRQPKLSFLCYSRSPPCVENFTSVCHICQVFKWSFYLHEIIKNALCVYT